MLKTVNVEEMPPVYPELDVDLLDTVPGIEKRDTKRNKSKAIIQDTPLFVKVERFINSRYDLKYNEVTNEVEYKKKDESFFHVLNENNLFRDLQHNNIKISMANLVTLLRSDYVEIVNPFEDYFYCLQPWKEGDRDYMGELSNYVTARDQVNFNLHFKKMLIRCVKCALDDTYFNKHALVLVGKQQNTGKSTFIRFLCPPRLKKYFSENISFQEKDNLIGLSENFIINIDELAVLNKIEINALKSYFSREVIKIRHPYDRKPISSPRRASFFGSTNKSEFLSDETGSVRWLCFEIEHIRFEYREEVDIDMVWAQAFALYKSNYPYQLTKEDIEQNEQRNQGFQNTSIEIELIQKYYSPGSWVDGDQFWTATDIIEDLLKKTTVRTNMNPVTVGRALSALGFVRGEKIKPGSKKPFYGYHVKISEF